MRFRRPVLFVLMGVGLWQEWQAGRPLSLVGIVVLAILLAEYLLTWRDLVREARLPAPSA